MGSSLAFPRVCLLMFLLVLVVEARGQGKFFNVMKYGAIADGKTDNSKAFSNAWNEACQWKGKSQILVPSGTYMLGPVVFEGPCNGPTVFLLKGALKAPTDPSSLNTEHWITFRHLENLTLAGGGSLDGQGASAWPYNNCNRTKSCKLLPISLRFDFVTNSKVHHISSIDSKTFHINIFSCKNLNLRKLRISAPADSPNTDGIHIGSSTDIHILDSVIATGDDCISMGQGSKNIEITRVQCGPGHGISVGSLGSSPHEEPVVGLTVRNCTISGTSNGVRIKTWAPSPAGIVSNLTFEDIIIDNVANPIIVDQQYCPSGSCNAKGASQVQIQDVKFRNIRGTSSTKLAVNLQCSSNVPCQKIELKDINLDYHGPDGPAASSCSHVNGVSYGVQKPPSCV